MIYMHYILLKIVKKVLAVSHDAHSPKYILYSKHLTGDIKRDMNRALLVGSIQPNSYKKMFTLTTESEMYKK